MTICRLIDFPNTKVRATVAETEDGDAIIFINARIAKNQQIKAYLHELRHIRRGDLAGGDVQAIERETHER